MRVLLASMLFVLATFSSPIASAQFSPPTPDVSIIAEPPLPAPNGEVRLVVERSLLDLSRANITWSVDGKTGLSGVGEKETSVTVGGAGVETKISVTVNALGESGS